MISSKNSVMFRSKLWFKLTKIWNLEIGLIPLIIFRPFGTPQRSVVRFYSFLRLKPIVERSKPNLKISQFLKRAEPLLSINWTR